MDNQETESFLTNAEEAMTGNEALTEHMTDVQAEVLYGECLLALEHIARTIPERGEATAASRELFRLCRSVDLWIESGAWKGEADSLAGGTLQHPEAFPYRPSPTLPLPPGWIDRLCGRLKALPGSGTGQGDR